LERFRALGLFVHNRPGSRRKECLFAFRHLHIQGCCGAGVQAAAQQAVPAAAFRSMFVVATWES
jgi:hypothetical protein